MRDGWVWTVRADGLDERKLARGAHPDWSPDGSRIAFDRDGETYTARLVVRRRTEGRRASAPTRRTRPTAASPLVADGQIIVAGNVVATGTSPDWSPDGRLAWVRDGVIYVAGRQLPPRLAAGLAARHAAVARAAARLRPARADRTRDRRRRRALACSASRRSSTTSAPAARCSSACAARAAAHDSARSASARERQDPRLRATSAQFRYTNSPPHHHWHLMRFDSFELRTLDGRTLVRDRKSGFCLADHWGAAPGRYPGRHPVFLGDCDQFHPEATQRDDGHLAGLHRPLPGVLPRPERRHHRTCRPGRYVLMHRVNATMHLRELRYDNDAASVRIRLTWHAARRRCASCAPARRRLPADSEACAREPALGVPGGERDDERRACGDDERLGGDAERDRLLACARPTRRGSRRRRRPASPHRRARRAARPTRRRRRRMRVRARSSCRDRAPQAGRRSPACAAPTRSRPRDHAHTASRGGVALSRTQPETRKRLTNRPAASRGSASTTAAAATPATATTPSPTCSQPPTCPTAKATDGERRHGDAVEQAEQEDRERDRAEARGAATTAPDDRDADHLVAATRQRDTADRGRATGGGERQHRGRCSRVKRRCQPQAFAA